MGQHRKAINDYNRAIALRPGFIEATYYRGRSHWSVGELIQAAKDFVVGFIKDKIPWVEDYVEPQQQPLLLLRSAPRPAAYRHRGIAHIQGPNEQITRSDYSFPLVPNLARTRFNYTNGIAYKELGGIRWFLAKYGAPMVGLSLVFLFLVWLTVKEVRKQAPRRSYKRAKEFSATGTYEFAVEAYTKAIQGEFEVEEAYLGRARAHAALGKHTQAATDFDMAISLNPRIRLTQKDVESFWHRGSSSAKLGHHEEALTDFAKAHELDPRPSKAIDAYTELIEGNPNYDAAYVERARARSGLGDHTKAAMDFDMAISLNPRIQLTRKDAETFLHRGTSLAKRGHHEEALSDFGKALEFHPKASTYRRRARAYAALGEHTKAAADFDMAISLNPRIQLKQKDAESFLHRGTSLANRGHHEEALSDFGKALELHPKASTYRWRAKAYAALGEHSKAAADFDMAISLNPRIQLKPEDAKSYFERGISLAKLKEHEEALSDFAKAIKFNPENSRTYYFIASEFIKEARSRIDRLLQQ